jgi:uncharacterized protein with PQ loop repeat
MKKNKKTIKHEEVIGWIGLGCLQTNAIPAIVKAIQTGNGAPVVSILMILIGLSCYLYRAIKMKDKLYIIGNLMGIITNLILLAVTL